MKKTLLLLASAALLLVSCAKEKFAEPSDGDLTNVTFTASVDGGVATKAVDYYDGNGANVNRCIMEIYFQNQLYKRLEEPTTSGVATFANVPVVAGKEYQILFWADHVDVVNTEAGLATDKYYTTKTTTDNKGLKAVTVNKSNFIDALKNKKNDELDAFFFAGNYTVPQNPTQPFDVSLKRPFAQLNVITTDVAAGKTVTSADLLPDIVSVSYKAANKINVSTGEISQVGEVADYTYTYEAPVYGNTSNWNAVKTRKELTLSMDYILASTEQAAVDVTFKTFNNGDANPVMTHNLTNLPYKRNYRTNVKGDLLTTNGSWTATINPIWSSPDIVKVVEVADIKSANQIINQYASTTKQLEVKFTAEPNDSGVPAGEEAGIRAIVTTPIQQDASLSIEVLTPTKELYIGDYKSEYIVSGEDVIKTDANHAVVNVNVPESSSIVKLVINAPSKSVYINGKEVANVGEITDLDAITSQSTLIIEKGQTVNKLTIRQGGLEIHGTVGEAIVPGEHGQIQVRDCENLDETKVYDILKPHIAEGYVGVKDRTTVGKWDIVPIVCKIGEIGYGSLADAVAAVPTTGVETIITMVADHEILGNAGVTIAANQNIILDLAGHTVKNLVNESKASQLITNKGTLKIIGNGTLTNALADGVIPGDWPTYNYVTNLISNLGTLTIENGTFINTQDSGITYTLDNNSNGVNAIATINGGTFKSVGNSAVRMFCNSTTAANTLTINDGYFEGHYYAVSVSNAGNGSENTKVGTLNINGGEFESLDETENYNVCIANWVSNKSSNISVNITSGKFNDYVCIASKASITGGLFKYAVYTDPDDGTQYKLADYVAEKYDLIENPDATTKDKYPWTVDRKHVAMIGSTKYYTLAEAVAAVPTSGTQTTITMIANHEILGNDGVTIAKTQNVILDLAGYTIKNLVNENRISQVIKNLGTLEITDSVGGGLITNSAAEGAITGEWWSTPQYNYQTNVLYNYGGHLIINGATIRETAASSICYAIDNNSNENDVTCTIKSGHITTLASTAIRMFCNSTTKENIINVEGGLIEASYAGIWTQLPGSSPEKKKAKLNISGGTLKGTYAWYDYSYGDLYDNVQVSISGGLLDGEIFSYGANIDISSGVFTSDVNIKQTKPSTISVTGGKFSKDVCAYGDRATERFISGGLFKIKTFEDQQQYYNCYWTTALVDGKTYVELPETDPGYAEGYRFKVVNQAQQ